MCFKLTISWFEAHLALQIYISNTDIYQQYTQMSVPRSNYSQNKYAVLCAVSFLLREKVNTVLLIHRILKLSLNIQQ